jgi:Asp-tRNA(Asn)/Glu-tRNA(Gln) amidotransferase A subunit family amidase
LVITRSLSESALLLETIGDYDNKDSTSSERQVPKFSSLINGDIKGKRVVIPKEYRMDGISEVMIRYWEKVSSDFEENDAQVIDITLPHTKYAMAVILSNFNETLIFSTNFRRTDRQTNTTKLIVSFRNFEKTPKKQFINGIICYTF